MTVGFLMVFCGFHFRVVESFVLTPQATKFIEEHSDGFDFGGDTYATNDVQNGGYNNPALFTPTYQGTTYPTPQWQNVGFNNAPEPTAKKTLTPPTWMGWPMICVGAVLWLFGFTAPVSS